MERALHYFIKYPLAANLIMVAVLLIGIFSLSNLKSTFFPEVPSRFITIQAVYPGASPEEIEEGIINKIEENLKGVSGVERITSISRENTGTVSVEVFRGYNTDVALEDIQNAVNRISSFPVGMEQIVVYKLENLGFAYSFSISGNVDLSTLKQYGRQAEEELRSIKGISKVTLSGFPEEEIEIAFREKDLRAYGLTFQQATQAIRTTNVELTGGTIKGDKEELLIRADNKGYYAIDLREIVVKNTPAGGVVRLHQIADIRDRWADNPNRSYMNGQPSVVVTVQNTLEEDLLTIAGAVSNYVDDFNRKNEVVKATTIRDGSNVLRQRIQLLVENGILGVFLVLLLLAMFLDWRLAFWVAVSIPVSFAGMFLIAYLFDITINVISLFGMIVVVGILVDDGIVVTESIYQRFEKGDPRMQAAISGTTSVLPAVFSSILTTVIAFTAFFFIDGRLGDIFSNLAAVVIACLLISLLESSFLLPAHIAHIKKLASPHDKNWLRRNFDRVMFFMRDRLYAPTLRFSLKNSLLMASFLIALFFITLGAIRGGIIKTTFFPVIERDDFSITLLMPAGTPDHITQTWLDHLEKSVWEANSQISPRFFNNEKQAVERVEKILGPSTFQGQINVAVLDGENRDSLSLREVINTVRKIAGPIYEAEAVTYGAQMPFGKPVSISLISNDYKQLDQATERIKSEMRQLSELSDVVDNNQEGLREVKIQLKEKALYLGLNVQDIVGQVRQGFFGSEVQRIQRGRDEVRIWVRYAEQDRADLTQLSDMRVRFADGREFPLSEIADLSIERGVISINHLDGKREVKVESDVSGDQVSVSDITTNLKSELLPSILKDFPAVSFLMEGQNREQEKSQKSMQIVVPVVMLLMFFSIALTFRSISQTLALMLMIPFSFIGVAWGHWVLEIPISFFSVLGMVALVGILVNDGIVLVTTYNQYLETGMEQMDALYESGVSRLRPIFLTSATTIAGLAPLVLEKSLQAQFLIPMAVSISFGLIASTLIILVLMPIMLLWSNRIKVYASWLWNGVKPSYEAVEAVTPEPGGYGILWAFAGSFAAVIVILAFFGEQLASWLK